MSDEPWWCGSHPLVLVVWIYRSICPRAMQEHGMQALACLLRIQKIDKMYISSVWECFHSDFMYANIYPDIFITEMNVPCAELTCMSEHRGITAWLTLLVMSASRQADLCVSPVSRLVPPQLLPTPFSCCHVAMATWEGPAFTTPGSQRRSLVWGKGCCAILVYVFIVNGLGLPC